jgi:hypothetical protein
MTEIPFSEQSGAVRKSTGTGANFSGYATSGVGGSPIASPSKGKHGSHETGNPHNHRSEYLCRPVPKWSLLRPLITEGAEEYVQHREQYCPTNWAF